MEKLKIYLISPLAVVNPCVTGYLFCLSIDTSSKYYNKNSQIQDLAQHCFHYQNKTYEQVIELKEVLIGRQQSEKQS